MYWTRSLVALAGLALAFTSDDASAQVYNWTGFYGGAHAGGVWGNADVTDAGMDVTAGPFTYKPSGFLGGGTAGYNWQVMNVVAGVEADFGYMGLSGAGIIPSSTPGYHQDITLKAGAYADLTARLGLTFGNILVYGKGGYVVFDTEAQQATTKPDYAPTPTSRPLTGWTLGGGVEQAVMPHVSVKIEYLHFEFAEKEAYQTLLVGDPFSPAGTRFYNYTKVRADSIKAGVNWHF